MGKRKIGGTMDIVDDTTLIQTLNSIAYDIISIVSDKILVQLKTDIERDVYLFGGFPNKFYYMGMGVPTFQFEKSWKWDVIRQDVMSTVRNLFEDIYSMSYEPENYLHGSIYGGDRRAELADDLNVSGVAKNSDFPEHGKERQPYWDNFIREMFDAGQIETWFSEELAKFGIIKI
jgi:hypothetical protein